MCCALSVQLLLWCQNAVYSQLQRHKQLPVRKIVCAVALVRLLSLLDAIVLLLLLLLVELQLT
jgi:hypothetical protein